MATIADRPGSQFYGDLLQVSNSNNGVDDTLRDVEDGTGTASALQISADAVNVDGDFSVSGDMNLHDHDHSGDSGSGGQLEADEALLATSISDGHVLTADGSGGCGWESPVSPHLASSWTDTDAEITDSTNWQTMLSVSLTLAKACDVVVSATWNTAETGSDYGTYWRIARGTTQVSNTVRESDSGYISGSALGGESALAAGSYTWNLQAKRRLTNNVTMDSCALVVIATET